MKRTSVLDPSGLTDAKEWAEYYEVNDQTHRIDGPAAIYYEDDRVVEEEWFARDLHHRLDGPAIVRRGLSGMSDHEVYYVLGKSDEGGSFADLLGSLSVYEKRMAVKYSPFAVFLEEGHDPVVMIDAIRAGVITVDGMREVLGGAPAEWVASFEEGSSARS